MLKFASIFNSNLGIPTLAVFTMIGSLVLYGTSRPWLVYILGGVLGVATAGTIAWDQGALWGYWGEQTAFWFGAVVLFMAVIGVDLLIGLYSLIYIHDGSGFNRRDGMLRICLLYTSRCV